MAKIVVDGKTYEVDSDNNLLQECLSKGLDLPYFCWHPSMGSVGACRQCAVKQYRDENDKVGTVVMACMTPAADGSIVSIDDPEVQKFRANVIESLMISHPHDCPVCEEGGECHLQDMTLMSGHNYRRYDRKKVTHRNQYLGPFINHEMNRCISCYRCVRYYDDYAGGTDLSAQASHHHVYFGRHEEGVLENEFSGNLVEVCPTGVFTDKPFSEHYSRKWDLQVAPSVCVNCAVGCNITPGERYGELRRVVNRYHNDINGYFLCDRGRFGYGYVNGDSRLTTARGGSDSQGLTDAAAVAALVELKGTNLVGIASPRASNEANFALKQFVGEENFFAGCSDADFESLKLIESLLQDTAFHCPSIREIEQADAVIILGEDVTNTAPRVALAVRQAAQNKAKELAAQSRIPLWQDAAVRELAQNERHPVTILSGYATRLDDIAHRCIIDSIDELATLGFALANQIQGTVSGAEDLQAIASELLKAKRPLVICGTSNGSPELIKAAANIARALQQQNQGNAVDLCVLPHESNALGMSMLLSNNNSLGEAFSRLQTTDVSNVLIIENDLFTRAASETVTQVMANAQLTVVLDQLETKTTSAANCVLPVTAFSEQESTWVNYEGRAQLSFQVHRNHSQAKSVWQWLALASTGQAIGIEDGIRSCSEKEVLFSELKDLLPSAQGLIPGMKIPRQSHRYSGRTAMKANVEVHEPKQAQDPDSIMAFSMEGVPASKDASVLAAAWSPQWNSNQAISKFQDEINGELKQGNSGIKLFKRSATDDSYFPATELSPSSEAIDGGGFKLISAFHIFGSEELSAHAGPIIKRMTNSYVAISPTDAQALNIAHGSTVCLSSRAFKANITCCIRRKVKPGTLVFYAESGGLNAHDVGSHALIEAGAEQGAGIQGLIVSDLI